MNSSFQVDAIPAQQINSEYIVFFQWERDFDYLIYRKWLQDHWYISGVSIVTYVTSIHFGEKFMKSRLSFSLRSPLIVWNLLLAVFSLAGALRVVPWVQAKVRRDGLMTTCCREAVYPGPVGFWLCAFTLSKIVELVDTFFVIARKRKLIFLHWYHHSSVLALSWHTNADKFPIAPLFGAINYSIHSLMYTYYAIQGMNLTIPPIVPMIITILQLTQMVAGLVLSLYTYSIGKYETCDTPATTIFFCALTYASYLFLFSRFFVNRYLMTSDRTCSINNSTDYSITHQREPSLKTE